VNENIIKKAKLIHDIVEQHYEPCNQNKCQLQAFRKFIKPTYPMSERTFWRYLRIAKILISKTKEDGQNEF
jgi:hypothetical protein